jgi:uncharacterized lipoprotein
VKRTLSIVLCAFALLSSLSACSTLRARFGSKSDAYKNSAQTRPLEVPPDLDAPNRSGSLSIPEPSATIANAATDSSVPAPLIEPSSVPPLDAQNLGGDGVQIADSLANTWKRVGLALERSGAATILARDESARTYDISATGKKIQSPGFLKRVVTLGMARKKSVATPVGLRVRVSGSDGASKVTVEGATTESGSDAARQVLETLRQRMS